VQPVAKAKVSLAWTEIFVSKTTGVVRTPHELHGETNELGFFKLCGLPSDLEATLQAERTGTSSPEFPITMNGALLDFQTISIPDSSGHHGTGIVTGHVLSPAGRPVADARIVIPMAALSTVTGEDGSFRFNAVQTGTLMVVARSLSYSPVAEAITVTSREPVDVTLRLEEKVARLDTVFVTARRNAYLEKSGFNARASNANGIFITREQIDLKHPFVITDMLKDLPGVTVTRERGGTAISGRRVFGLNSSNGCARIFVDGFAMHNLQPGDFDWIVPTDDVVGIELYQPGDAPTRFRSLPECLTVVVWTQFRGKSNN
jgi:hypothetical protein